MMRQIRVLVDKQGDFTPPAGTKVIAGTQFRDLAELLLLVPDGDGEGAVPKGGRDAHYVRCPSCGDLFELFAAGWCDHGPPQPSKLCPHCGVCVCLDANYSDRRFWREAPPAFQRHGIRELFVRYL
jgi:hypothetical protein